MDEAVNAKNKAVKHGVFTLKRCFSNRLTASEIEAQAEEMLSLAKDALGDLRPDDNVLLQTESHRGPIVEELRGIETVINLEVLRGQP